MLLFAVALGSGGKSYINMQPEIEAEQQSAEEKNEQTNSSLEPDETGGMNMTM